MKSEKGSNALEMTLIFPIVIFIIVILMFFGLFMYEQVAAQAVVDDVVSRTAANWSTAEDGIYTEKTAKEDFSVWKIYGRLIDFSNGRKKENMVEEAMRRLQAVCPIKIKFQEGDVVDDSKSYLIYRTLSLRVNRKFPLPLAGFLRRLGLPEYLEYTLYGTAVVQDQAELIRTVDMAVDLTENTPLGNAMSKVKDALQKLGSFFADFNLTK